MSDEVKRYMSAMGRKGGSSTSKKKQLASRANGLERSVSYPRGSAEYREWVGQMFRDGCITGETRDYMIRRSHDREAQEKLL